MTRKEKRYTWAFGVAGLLLFAAGVALGVLILPHAVSILVGFMPTDAAGYLQYSSYFSFVMVQKVIKIRNPENLGENIIIQP